MSCSVPGIVASASYVNQTAVFGPTTIYTPAAAGLFRISVYVETSDTTSGHEVVTKISATDDVGTITPIAFDIVVPSVGHANAGGDAIFRAAASTNIAITTSVNGGNTLASPYSIYVTVEAL